ncbi:MAG: hypothetical protein KGD60_15175 [Candidatus Thorarchaeota archaeon]|nr:hypothetical protein [Candidatus Thorarchaeota archaeon]
MSWILTITGPAEFDDLEHIVVRAGTSGDGAIIPFVDGHYVFSNGTMSPGQTYYAQCTFEFLWGAPNGAYSIDISIDGDWTP